MMVRKGNNMRTRILALFFLIQILLGIANAEDKIKLYIECTPGQQCIDLAYENGIKESVLSTPAQELGKADIKSANVQLGKDGQQGLAIELDKEAARKIEKITGDNIGGKIVVVFNDKILIAPIVQTPISGGRILISEHGRFWEKTPWLQDLIKNSYQESGRQRMIFAIIAIVVVIAALLFILISRMKKTRYSSPE
jgi:hypothetical protein